MNYKKIIILLSLMTSIHVWATTFSIKWSNTYDSEIVTKDIYFQEYESENNKKNVALDSYYGLINNNTFEYDQTNLYIKIIENKDNLFDIESMVKFDNQELFLNKSIVLDLNKSEVLNLNHKDRSYKLEITRIE